MVLLFRIIAIGLLFKIIDQFGRNVFGNRLFKTRREAERAMNGMSKSKVKKFKRPSVRAIKRKGGKK